MTLPIKFTKAEIRSTLAVLYVIMAFVCTIMVIKKAIPVENEAIAHTILGSMWATGSMIIGYYFGSSKNESDKEMKSKDSTL